MARGTDVIDSGSLTELNSEVSARAGKAAIIAVIMTAKNANTTHVPRVIIFPPAWIFK
jgi:hypothetical protein